ncbi:MAG: OmpW family protein [Novosphingobium sp.]|nr:OmpW family protein [Novosphingobium sp.]
MRKLTSALALAMAMAATTQAHAANAEGKWQVKVLGTAVLPDGEIDKIKYADPAVAAVLAPLDVQTKANDNVVPTVAIEYFFTPNISLETICCVTQHDVDGTRDITGVEMVADAKIIPATFTLKYHLDAGPIKPYIGAGPTYFIFIDEKPGSGATAVMGATKFKLDDSLGFALQAGIDVPINDSGMSLSLDAKKYWLSADAKWYDNTGTKLLETKHNLDPWVLSAGVGFRF